LRSPKENGFVSLSQNFINEEFSRTTSLKSLKPARGEKSIRDFKKKKERKIIFK
jgi:hypothetical protein